MKKEVKNTYSIYQMSTDDLLNTLWKNNKQVSVEVYGFIATATASNSER